MHPPSFSSRQKPAVVLVSGPTGIGKTTAISRLMSENPAVYCRPLSYTTRERRPEEDESEYQFVDRRHIDRLHNAGKLLNYDHVYQNVYAIRKSSVDDALAAGLCPVKEVHPTNISKIRRFYPNVLAVLLIPTTLLRGRTPRAVRAAPPPSSRDADQSYYAQVDLSLFDIVVPVSENDPVAIRAGHMHRAISAIRGRGGAFPHPGRTDVVNLAGYSAVASEFTEEKRATTAYFHKLSEPFLRAALSSLVTDKCSCLEIGPGAGWLLDTLALPRMSYIGLDISPEMVKALRVRFPAAKFEIGAARMLPFRADAFEVVICSLADPYCYPAALCEMNRVLTTGGRVVLTAPARHWASGLRGEKTDKTFFALANGTYAEVYSFTFDMDGLVALLSLSGFDTTIAECVRGIAPAPPMVAESARALELELGELGVVNCVVAVKD